MNDSPLSADDQRFEQLLDRIGTRADGPPTGGLHADPALAEAWRVQERIDGSLAKLFAVETPSETAIAALLAKAGAKRASEGVTLGERLRRPASRRTAALAAAAAIGAILLWRPWAGPAVPQSRFTPQPLAAIYRATVKQGFEPYYECHDAERFAATFAHRQDAPLKLLPMASGSRMLGLSYLGGLSPDTTAMLCIVDEKPVLAFVDRVEHDSRRVTADAGDDLHIFRRTLGDLVIYEVTPFETPRVMDALATAG